MSDEPIKVGDELAFRVGFGHTIEIHKVERITPSGRITCGRWHLDPNLRVRGRNGYHSPSQAERVTDEIRAEVAETHARSKLRYFIEILQPKLLTVEEVHRLNVVLVDINEAVKARSETTS